MGGMRSRRSVVRVLGRLTFSCRVSARPVWSASATLSVMAVSVPGLGTATAISTPVPAVRASAIVRELQRDREGGVPKQLDRRLQVVPALACDPDLVALHARMPRGDVT